MPSHAEHEATVIEALVGDVPRTMTVASELLDEQLVPDGGRKGDQLLVSLREVDGVWVIVNHVRVSFEADEAVALSNTTDAGVDLPPSLATLRAEVQAADAAPNCGERLGVLKMDRQAFEDELAKPDLCAPANTQMGGPPPEDDDGSDIP